MATHAAYSVLEFHDVVREHMMTPIELLDSIGMLRPTLNIGHGNFIADNPNLNYALARDLELMGRAGASISHCPINIIRRARVLDNWKKYQAAGVNMSIGSDTYPRDMVMNMRTASYMGKVMSHSYFAASAGEVFAAATLGGAKSVGRDDIGRLAPGALADIIIIDLTGRDTLRYGPVRDPVKSVVECGIGDDVETVIVDGKLVMENRDHPRRGFREDQERGAGGGREGLGHAARLGSARPHRRVGLSLVLPDGRISGAIPSSNTLGRGNLAIAVVRCHAREESHGQSNSDACVRSRVRHRCRGRFVVATPPSRAVAAGQDRRGAEKTQHHHHALRNPTTPRRRSSGNSSTACASARSPSNRASRWVPRSGRRSP